MYGWGTRIRTLVNGARTRRPAARRSPNSETTFLFLFVSYVKQFFIFCLGAGCKAFVRQPEKASIDKGPETVKQFLQKKFLSQIFYPGRSHQDSYIKYIAQYLFAKHMVVLL